MHRILLIDDEPDIVRVLAMSLRADGHTVHTACSGEEGVALFREYEPDIVITDIRMPGMDGIEVLKRVRSLSDRVEVIIVTGHGDVDVAIEALKYGASDFINKPVRDEALAVALKRAGEKLAIQQQIRDHTRDLEEKVEEATRALRRQTVFLQELINSSWDGIVGIDADGAIAVYNPAAERIFGKTARQVLGVAIDALEDEVRCLIEQAISSNVCHLDSQEITVTAASGERIPVDFSGSCLFDSEAQIGFVGFFHDLREIRRLQQELIEKERLATIGQTVAGLAHCIKNILHGLEGGSYILDAAIKRKDYDKLTNGWRLIQRTVHRTADLLKDLLTYSKKREPEYRTCHPAAIVKEVCDLLQPVAAKSRVSLDLQAEPEDRDAWLDPQTLYRVAMNLISNAIDACMFDENRLKSFHVQVKLAISSGKRVDLWVVDNGSGMDEETLSKLFISFFSTKGSQGTGLGLLVTRKLVEEHGGGIEVQSRAGEGTTFHVWLPILQAQPPDDQGENHGQESVVGGR
ncbi:ATP-binding response regulator [Desulfatirhabdium butyrativorans]|uniref:ATP-binding response regulator n=1 Tax=Desulfatirhabdium butyrativorans TaxID=340467 RepID=UPI00042754C1|nr:response regulator [Desulfatirhabdium butyrativorans]